MSAEGVQANLQRVLRDAMKSRDRVAASASRSALTAIANAEAVPAVELAGASEHVAGAVAGVGAAEVARRVLGEAEMRAVVEHEIAERAAAAAEYERLGRNDDAMRLHQEIEVLRSCLV